MQSSNKHIIFFFLFIAITVFSCKSNRTGVFLKSDSELTNRRMIAVSYVGNVGKSIKPIVVYLPPFDSILAIDMVTIYNQYLPEYDSLAISNSAYLKLVNKLSIYKKEQTDRSKDYNRVKITFIDSGRGEELLLVAQDNIDDILYDFMNSFEMTSKGNILFEKFICYTNKKGPSCLSDSAQ